MLHTLVEYAKRNGLDAEAGFVPKTVRWLIVFSKKGEFLNVVDQVDANDKRSKGRVFSKVPHLILTSAPRLRQFLVDSAQYALLYGQDKPDKKLLDKHDFFIELLENASASEPFFKPIAAALRDDAIRLQICAALDAEAKSAKPADNVTFAVMEDGLPRVLVERDTWHDWWRNRFEELSPDDFGEIDQMRCLLTGKLTIPADKHPKIKGLSGVGGKVETNLISFNAKSFCSYGFDVPKNGSLNAAVHRDAAEQYAMALNHLIAHQSETLAGAKVVYWYSGLKDELKPEEDPVNHLINAIDVQPIADQDENGPAGTETVAFEKQATGRVRETLQALRTGKRPELIGARFHVMTISGNAARVVVRSYIEGELSDLIESVEAWFRDFEIVHRYGRELAKKPKFISVLGAMVRDLKDIEGPWVDALFLCALLDRPIPFDALARTLARVRIDIIQDEPLSHARFGLLKAFRRRIGDKDMTTHLNEEHPEPAYHCGRLMAVLAYIQYRALGDVGAGVVQRYYAAASTTPALVLGRLMRAAQFHLDKIEEKGLRIGLDNRLAEVWTKLKDRVPATLTLEEQTLFAMGYYHQKAHRVERPEALEEAANN